MLWRAIKGWGGGPDASPFGLWDQHGLCLTIERFGHFTWSAVGTDMGTAVVENHLQRSVHGSGEF